jgi:hypothetical protein
MKDYYPDVTFEDSVFRFDLPNGDEFVIVPPKPRELSDEEIEEIYFKDFNYEGEDFIEFAKAVLRKAQQK